MKIVPDVAATQEPEVLIDDDTTRDHHARPVEDLTSPAAEAARETAFHAEYTWKRWDPDSLTWSPYRLHPLTLDRWTWWHRMELHNAPIPREQWADPATWNDAHVPTAWSLLYLCSHDPETILDLVPSPALYWYAVNQWAAEHCPGELWNAALQQMRAMEQATKLTIATPRPTARQGRPRGNAPRP